MNRREVVVFCLAAVVFLLLWAGWRRHQGQALPLVGSSCEERCLLDDPDCRALAASQGGFPAATLSESERQARCNGLCYVLRAKYPGRDDACLDQ